MSRPSAWLECTPSEYNKLKENNALSQYRAVTIDASDDNINLVDEIAENFNYVQIDILYKKCFGDIIIPKNIKLLRLWIRYHPEDENTFFQVTIPDGLKQLCYKGESKTATLIVPDSIQELVSENAWKLNIPENATFLVLHRNLHYHSKNTYVFPKSLDYLEFIGEILPSFHPEAELSRLKCNFDEYACYNWPKSAKKCTINNKLIDFQQIKADEQPGYKLIWCVDGNGLVYNLIEGNDRKS